MSILIRPNIIRINPYRALHYNKLAAIWGIILFFIFSAFNVHAQEGVQQRFFTSQNGLKISWVNSITKGPNSGITIVHSPKFYFANYDGIHFDYTISPSGIQGKTYEDFSGNFWSLDEGNLNNVNFYSNEKWQNLKIDAGTPFMPTPNIGNKLLFIKDGDFKEFDKVKQQTRIIKQAEESQIGQFIDMITFQDGSVWITGEYGLAKYIVQSDDSKEQWIGFPVPKELGLYHFNKPFEGEKGELTFMSKSSKSKQNILVGFDGKRWQKLYVSQTDEVYCGWRGHDNSLWIIKGNHPLMDGPPKNWKLFHIQQGKETIVVKNRILNRVLNDIVVEPNGTFWLATGSGLACFSPSLWRKQTVKGDLNRRVKKIHEDLSGRLWFAMENSVSLFSDDKWELHQFNPAVFSGDVCSLKNGLVVVGTSDSGGLAIFNQTDKSSSVTFPFGNEKVRFFDQDKNGNCFIILQDLNNTSRLIRYDGEHIEQLADDLKIDRLAPGECEVTDIIQTSSGDIWIVTYADIIVYKKGIRKSFDLKEEFEWGLSTAILELENGNIWISGNNGILQYDGENWSLVQTPEFETARMMIISKDSSVWVASGTGVHRLIDGIWISNTNEDGLPNATIFDIFEDKQGKIWTATLKGVYCYYPEADTIAPETHVPSEVNFDEAVPRGEMQFVFDGHDKWDNTPNNRLLYSYRVDENPWSPFKNETTVIEHGLSAGPHVFEVRTIDRNGNIDLTPASWPFTVLLPWYLETYFIILLIFSISLILLSLGFAITRHFQVEKLVIIRTEQLEKSKIKAEKGETELQLKNEEYESINEELNQTNEDLYKAKEKAEESDRLKSAFLANMSHEIRTPMNGIFGFSNLLLEEDFSAEEREEYLQVIVRNSHQLLSLIDDIIDISKIEANELQVSLNECNVVDILNDLEENFNHIKLMLNKEHIELKLKIPPEYQNLVIKTDGPKLQQVISNLINNALKFSEKGTITFGFKVKKSRIEFFVSDQGIGIPQEKLNEIFERFKQLNYKNAAKYGGTGLGLAISKGIIKVLGGDISVKSELDIGSTFSFKFPLNESTIGNISEWE